MILVVSIRNDAQNGAAISLYFGAKRKVAQLWLID
jgi:hypothetical protein